MSSAAAPDSLPDSLFVEPFSGMAGDMLLGALLDLGDPRFTLEHLCALAADLVPGEAQLSAQKVWRGSLSGLALDVRTPERGELPHRGIADLEALLSRSTLLSSSAKERARAVLWRIAVAEGRVHGCAPEEIHFHEIGAVDTLVDVCGAVHALERLGVRKVFASAPLVGSGTVRCAHGDMPVPVPAVAELLRGRPHHIGGGGERLTPTGAALLVELVPEFGEPGAFVASAIGYGAGQRDPREGPPNILRVQLGRAGSLAPRPEVWTLECNLDDMTGEELGFLVQELRAKGALEVWTSAVAMKKDRPGVIVAALARASSRAALETVLFDHSTALGLRWTRSERTECERVDLEVRVGEFRVRGQRRLRPGADPRSLDARDIAFEYDDLAALARARGLALRAAEQLAREAFALTRSQV
ncbi:MAG: nickel pincer cofactor biosynthesis protein LarC [Planctomycetes bacterium]|nr:nickel pincer cofactor biosynthesis protein LarC [Planctomycetota bacterium]